MNRTDTGCHLVSRSQRHQGTHLSRVPTQNFEETTDMPSMAQWRRWRFVVLDLRGMKKPILTSMGITGVEGRQAGGGITVTINFLSSRICVVAAFARLHIRADGKGTWNIQWHRTISSSLRNQDRQIGPFKINPATDWSSEIAVQFLYLCVKQLLEMALCVRFWADLHAQVLKGFYIFHAKIILGPFITKHLFSILYG